MVAKWDDRYKTGYTPVDEQHENLFALVNELHDAIIAGNSTGALAPTLHHLAKSTIEHFAEEEKLMTSIDYPQITAHKAKHEDLTRQAKELLAKFQQSKPVLSTTISTFLANWLEHHIKDEDFTLIQYTRKHPVAQTLSASAP